MTRFPEEVMKKIYQLMKYPKYKPAYQRFALMENEWLAVIVDSIKDEYALIDIFDQEGRYIGNFKTTIPVEGKPSLIFIEQIVDEENNSSYRNLLDTYPVTKDCNAKVVFDLMVRDYVKESRGGSNTCYRN